MDAETVWAMRVQLLGDTWPRTLANLALLKR